MAGRPRGSLRRLQQFVAMRSTKSKAGASRLELAANYLAFIKLASIRIWLRANESAN